MEMLVSIDMPNLTFIAYLIHAYKQPNAPNDFGDMIILLKMATYRKYLKEN